MSGTSSSKFTAAATVPNQESWGHYQRFNFSDTFPHVKLQAYSQFIPTSVNTSTIDIESRNSNYSGFRWHHLSQVSDINLFGSFYFQSFLSDGDGTNIFGFDGTNFNFYFPVSMSYPLEMGSNKITSLATPVNPTDAVNKTYVDSAIAGASSVTLTGAVTGTGVTGTPFATTIVSKLNQIPVATGSVNINSQNVVSVGNLGIGVASPNHQIEFPGTVSDCKISLYAGTNNFQVYGFGVIANTLKYNIDQSTSSHVFYVGASTTTSTELFRITGTGYATVSGGDGTFYSRVPSAHISLSGGSTTTTPTGSWVKLNGTTSASAGAVQFTTSSNRITFTGSDLGLACRGMITGSAVLLFNVLASANLAIYKNGSLVGNTFCWATNTAVGTSVSVSIPNVMISLSPADYLEIWVLSIGVTITTQYLNLSFVAC